MFSGINLFRYRSSCSIQKSAVAAVSPAAYIKRRTEDRDSLKYFQNLSESSDSFCFSLNSMKLNECSMLNVQ